MNNERNKVVYDLDLNSPPADSQEGNLISQDDAVSAATSGAVNSHPLPNIGSYCTPIIVDSDEADMLSAPTGFPQKRNVTRPTQEPAKAVPNEPNDEPAKVVPKKNKEPEKIPDTEPLNKPIEEPAKKPNSEPADEFPTMTCPICLHPLVKASSTICGHVFCAGCIKEALRVSKKCPTCRTKLTIKKVHPIFLPRSLSG